MISQRQYVSFDVGQEAEDKKRSSLMKSPVEDLPQNTQQNESAAKEEDL